MTEERANGGGRFPMRIHGRLTLTGVGRQWSPKASLADALPGDWRLVLRPGSVGILGWTAADLAVIPALELLHPDDRDVLTDLEGRTGPGRLPFRPLELRLLARDSRYWLTRWHLGAGPDGAPVACGVEYLRPDGDAGPPVGTWHWDADRDVVSWSPELLDMFGMNVGPPASYDAFLAVVLDEDRAGMAGHIDETLAGGRPFVATFRCPTGEERDLWFLATGCRCDGEGGRRRLAGLVKYLNPPQTWAVGGSPIGSG